MDGRTATLSSAEHPFCQGFSTTANSGKASQSRITCGMSVDIGSAVGRLLQNRSRDSNCRPFGRDLHRRLLQIDDYLQNIRAVLADCPPELQLEGIVELDEDDR